MIHTKAMLSLFVVALFVQSCGNTASTGIPAGHKKTAHQVNNTNRILSIVGTNDLHGHIEMLPLLGGFVANLRAKNQGALILVDGGDMFQGTLASNLQEGAPIVQAYNLLGYHAATIGNHEFDFGPVGKEATVQTEGQDPRGALKARAASANFSFLGANLIDDATDAPIDWPNVRPTTLVEVAGIQVGIIGISTFETPHVTLSANIEGLHMAPLATTIAHYAKTLRAQGASVIIVAAHAGGHCKDCSNYQDTSSCEQDQEIMEVAKQLPPNAVDVIVAGHTHRAMAHQVNGIAIIESYSRGQAFGRVDLELLADGTTQFSYIHPPQSLCVDQDNAGPQCEPGKYEGKQVTPDKRILALAQKADALAAQLRSQPLGIHLDAPIVRSRSHASALGNLFVDLMLRAHPEADLAITNGGSLRADLPQGELLYGDLFEAMPFDNRFAMVRISGKALKHVFLQNLQKDNGILSVAGLRVKTSCVKGQLKINLKKKNGKIVRDKDTLLLATSDFLASGGDGLIGPETTKPQSVEIDGGLLIRDAMAEQLRQHSKEIQSSLPTLLNTPKARIQYTGRRPLSCL